VGIQQVGDLGLNVNDSSDTLIPDRLLQIANIRHSAESQQRSVQKESEQTAYFTFIYKFELNETVV
jgi:hypothetical protein